MWIKIICTVLAMLFMYLLVYAVHPDVKSGLSAAIIVALLSLFNTLFGDRLNTSVRTRFLVEFVIYFGTGILASAVLSVMNLLCRKSP